MRTTKLVRASIDLLLASALLVAGTSGMALAAKGDRGDRGDREAETGSPPAVVASVSGTRYKMAKAKVAQRVTRIGDTAADQVMADGTPALDAPAWSDMVAVYMAPIKVPQKLLTKMDDAFPRGAAGAFYGKDADWSELDRALFVAVELAQGRPPDSGFQQVEVGLDGDAAGPVQVGSATDTRAGVERFSLSGRFNDGSESSGTTDVSGRRPGDPIDYHNAESAVFGFYDAGKSTYYLIMPLTRETQSVAVGLRTGTDAGEVIDRLELPGGGHLVGVNDPAAGFDGTDGAAPLSCRALETFSASSGVVSLGDPAGTRIRYSAAVDPSLDATEADSLLAALGEGTVSLELTPLDPTGEPFTVDGALTRMPSLRAFALTMDVPAGQWSFEAVDGTELLTPAGEALIDHSSLTGRAGVRTGEGLDGFVAGDPDCARWDLGADACQFVPADGMAALVGLAAPDLEQTLVTRADGARWCVGKVPATGEPQYIARFGTGYYTTDDFERGDIERGCDGYPIALGAEGVNVDCGADGFENYSFRVLPEATAADDPDGGLLVSVDMLVDGTKPYGERYDRGAALTLFGDMARAVAQSAAPGDAASTGVVTDETTP